MDGGDIFQIIIIIALIGLSAFFSSAETAFTTINKIKLRTLCDEGDKGAERVSKILETPSRMLSSILVGNNIVNIGVSSLVTTFTLKHFGGAATGISTAILTVVLLIVGEITPKNLATQNAERIACLYSKPISVIILVLTPVVFVIDILSSFILKLFHTNNKKPVATITEAELRALVDVGHEEGVFREDEQKLIHNVFELDDSCAKDIMIPRIDVCMVSSDATFDEVMDVFRESSHSRIPVFQDDPDKIVGVLHSKDMLLSGAYTDAESKERFRADELMREPFFTFENQKTSILFKNMQSNSVSAAIVLDEYGTVAGLVTTQDIVEELTGQLRDEYDSESDETFKEISDGRYIADGAYKLDDINDILDSRFSSEDNDSIGGLIIEKLDRFPHPGESIDYDDFKLTVVGTANNRITKVLLEKLK